MYESYWGLNEPAFSLTPDPRFLYMSRNHEDALVSLIHAVQRNKGAALLMGEIGHGKTTVSRKLIEMLDPVQYRVVLNVNPILTPAQMIQEILSQLGVGVDTSNRQALVQRLHIELTDLYARGQRAVVIVDEAHMIKSSATFEELRLLLNCQMNDQFLLTLIFIGQLELRRRIEKVPALCQRLAVQQTLGPLDATETGEMILHRLRVAGYTGARSPFTPDAIHQMHRATGGSPRLIAQVADSLLATACAQREEVIDAFLAHQVVEGMPQVAA
jgi:general secretion pathway protein A